MTTRLLLADETTTLIPEAIAGVRWLPSRPPMYRGDPNVEWAVQVLTGGAWVVVAEFYSGHFGPAGEWVVAERKASEYANRLLDHFEEPTSEMDRALRVKAANDAALAAPRPGEPTLDLVEDEDEPLGTEDLFPLPHPWRRLRAWIRRRWGKPTRVRDLLPTMRAPSGPVTYAKVDDARR